MTRSTTLSPRRILSLWLPLCASWALMTVEYPIIQAAISRLPDIQVMLAATSLVIGLEITIESPVIMLLATSTALAKSPSAYRVLRRFTHHLNIGVTLLAAAVAGIDPLYEWLVPGLMEIPPDIAAAARPALYVMIPWSAVIGWRRLCQGILIRHGRSRQVGYGTAVRLVCAAGTAAALCVLSLNSGADGLPGVLVGAWSWMAGVTGEVIYAHFAANRVIAAHLSGDDPPGAEVLSYGDVVRYHAPLAATSLLSLLAMPLVQAALSRMPEPVQNLAAWPVVFGILLFFRSPGFAWPEAVIALLVSKRQVRSLYRFTIGLTAAVTLGLVLFLFTPVLDLYLVQGLDLSDDLIPYVLPGALVGLALPALQTLQAWYRGVLMTGKATHHVYWGMGIGLATVAVGLWIAVEVQGPGVAAAAAALAVGMITEAAYLAWGVRAVLARLPETG